MKLFDASLANICLSALEAIFIGYLLSILLNLPTIGIFISIFIYINWRAK